MNEFITVWQSIGMTYGKIITSLVLVFWLSCVIGSIILTLTKLKYNKQKEQNNNKLKGEVYYASIIERKYPKIKNNARRTV